MVRRRSTQRKAKHPGQKCIRGKGVLYCELKQPLKLTLTPTAIRTLEVQALEDEISISELVERLTRGSVELRRLA